MYNSHRTIQHNRPKQRQSTTIIVQNKKDKQNFQELNHSTFFFSLLNFLEPMFMFPLVISNKIFSTHYYKYTQLMGNSFSYKKIPNSAKHWQFLGRLKKFCWSTSIWVHLCTSGVRPGKYIFVPGGLIRLTPFRPGNH